MYTLKEEENISLDKSSSSISSPVAGVAILPAASRGTENAWGEEPHV